MRAHLAAYGLALALPVLLFAALVINAYSRAERSQIEQRAIDTARDIAVSIDRELSGIISALRVLAASPALEQGDMVSFYNHALATQRDIGAHVALIDAEGHTQLHTAFPLGAGLPRSNLPYPHASPTGSQAYVSGLLVGSVSKRQVFAVTVPIERNGAINGIVAIAPESTRLARLLEALTPAAARWRTDVLGNEGIIIARSHEHERYVGQTVPAPVLEFSRKSYGVLRTTGIDGAEIYRAHAHSQLAGWIISASIPVAVVEAPLRGAWRTFLFAGATLLAAAVLLAMLFGRTMSRPIQAAADAARSLGRGDPIHSIRSRLIEVNEVGAALVVAHAERAEGERNRAQLAAIVESSSDAIIGLSSSGRIATWNPAASQLLGYDSSEAIGNDICTLVGNEGHEKLKSLSAAVLSGTPAGLETICTTKSGERLEVEASGAPVRAVDGTVIGASFVLRDITTRKLAQQQLVRANEHMQLALQAGNMSTFEVDLATTQLGSCQHLSIFDGHFEAHDGAVDLDRLIHPDDRGIVEESRQRALASGNTYESEYRIIRRDGAIRWLHVRALIRRDGNGIAERMLGVISDITERKESEKRLRETKDQAFHQLGELEALYATAPIGLALLDTQLHYLRINKAMAAIAGAPPQAHLGCSIRQMLGGLGERLEPHLEHVLASGEAQLNVEASGESPQDPGTTRHWNVHIYPLRDAMGMLSGVGVIMDDITEDKRTEERQKLLIRELRHRANNMLAVVQSVARRSLTGSPTLASARAMFLDRLQALARAHDMLTESDWRGVLLGDIVRLELDGVGERAKAKGPRVALDPGPAQTFALVVHELTVNALKHGALSNPSGRIDVNWDIDFAGGEPRFRFVWQERGGPEVSFPDRKGFGTELLERAIVEDFDKPARISFAPEGLRFEIDVPLGVVSA